MKKASNKQTPKASKKQTGTTDEKNSAQVDDEKRRQEEEEQKKAKLKLLDEHILVLMKDLMKLQHNLVELQTQRCKLTGMETASRQSPGSMLDAKAARRLMGVSQ